MKFECTKTNICQDTARYVFCLFWSDLSIPGKGQKCSSRILCHKTICNDCLWYFQMNCEVWMYKNHSFPRYSQICVLPNLVNFIDSRGGVKTPSQTLCPKTICNYCLCYSEIICEVWMYKNQYLPRYSYICVLPISGQICQYPGWGKNFIPNTLPQNYL